MTLKQRVSVSKYCETLPPRPALVFMASCLDVGTEIIVSECP
jgi:hypothetical protein